MENQAVLVLVFILVCVLLLKAFKAIITVAGSILMLVLFAFFLRSQNIINFDVPKSFSQDMTLKSFNFSVNDSNFFTDAKKAKDEDKKEKDRFENSKSKESIEKLKEQEQGEEQNIKKE